MLNEINSMILIGWGVAYFLGCFPTGYLISKFVFGYDITRQGSGNIGMTNVVRTAGKKWGAVTLVGDFGKGILAMYVFTQLNPQNSGKFLLVAGLFCLLGHVHNVFLKFKGGKGIATHFGIWLFFYPTLFAIMALTWIAVFFLTKISSLSALTMLAVFIIVATIHYGIGPIFWLSLMEAGYLFFLHRTNIARLLRGEESRLKGKS